MMLATHFAKLECEGQLECMRVLIEAKANLEARRRDGGRALHIASYTGGVGAVKILIDAKADVNARDDFGSTPVMIACAEERAVCAQLLVDANADINTVDNTGKTALYGAMLMPKKDSQHAHRVPGMPFSVLSCNADATDPLINDQVTQAVVDGHLAEYKRVHNFIDECHSILKLVLSEHVPVDPRFGLGQMGIYQEPLERTLEYLGMSMNKDQVVNTSIDGAIKRRALLPGNVLESIHWHDEHRKIDIARAIKLERQARRERGGY
jgi:hypothetical protein